MNIKKSDSKGRITGFQPNTHYFVARLEAGEYLVWEVPETDLPDTPDRTVEGFLRSGYTAN